jgi:hypothetical protein
VHLHLILGPIPIPSSSSPRPWLPHCPHSAGSADGHQPLGCRLELRKGYRLPRALTGEQELAKNGPRALSSPMQGHHGEP